MTVFSIPLRTRFRGITVREGVLVEGDAGWGEFSLFLEYDAATAAPWLACAREAADLRGDSGRSGAKHILEHGITVPEPFVLLREEGATRLITGVLPEELHEARRIPHRQIAQYQHVDQAEDRGIGADADRQGQERDDSEDRGAAQRSDGLAHVLSQSHP